MKKFLMALLVMALASPIFAQTPVELGMKPVLMEHDTWYYVVPTKCGSPVETYLVIYNLGDVAQVEVDGVTYTIETGETKLIPLCCLGVAEVCPSAQGDCESYIRLLPWPWSYPPDCEATYAMAFYKLPGAVIGPSTIGRERAGRVFPGAQ